MAVLHVLVREKLKCSWQFSFGKLCSINLFPKLASLAEGTWVISVPFGARFPNLCRVPWIPLHPLPFTNFVQTLSQSRSRRLSLFLQGISKAGCSAVGGTLIHGCCCLESQPAASLCTQTLHSVVHSRATPEGQSLQVASALLLITLSDAPKICAEHTKALITFLMLSACLSQGTHSKITLQQGVMGRWRP